MHTRAIIFFFFSSRRRHTRFSRDWSSDVCSSDLLCLAKGLTGGYLPLAATLTTERVFEAFLGGPEKTLYYGHSYTANPLGCAAGLASLAIFREERVLENLSGKITKLANLLEQLRMKSPWIGDVRQCGFIAGIEL